MLFNKSHFLRVLIGYVYFYMFHISDLPLDDMADSKPHAIQIVLANKDHTFSLDEDALARVLMQNEIKDRYVVVVSVAGAFRKGKSFILDFFLRYMKSKVRNICAIVINNSAF